MKKFHDVILDEAGNIVVGAEVYFRDNTTLALLSLYSDNGSTATANPVVSGADGYITAYFADATVKIEVYIDGELEKTITDYQHYDALDNEIKALRSVTSAANKGFYFTGAGTGAVYDLVAFGRSLGGAADAAAAQALLDLEPGTDVQAYDADLATIAALADPNADRILFWDDSAGAYAYLAPSTGLAISTTNLAVDAATTAQVLSNTADKVLLTDDTWAAADYVALTDAATVAVDLSLGINFSLTIGGNRTLGAPSNTKNGQAGEIIITQDGTGSRTLAYHANWKFAGGSDPVLSTAAGAIDVLSYKVINSTFVIGALSKAFA